MRTDLRPLSTGELLDKVFSLYRNNFLVFAGIAAIANVVALVLQVLTDLTNGRDNDLAFGGGLILTSLITVAGGLIASAIAEAGTVYAVSTIYLGGVTSIAGALRKVAGKAGRIFLINFAVGLLVGLGSLLFLLPGLYALASYALAIPAAVLEDLTVSDALARSSKLSEGSRMKILLIYILVLILVVSVSAALGLVEQQVFSLSSALGSTLANLLNAILQFAIDTLVFPLLTIALVLVYYDQRVRKEAFDLQRLMEAMGEAPPASAMGAGGPIG